MIALLALVLGILVVLGVAWDRASGGPSSGVSILGRVVAVAVSMVAAPMLLGVRARDWMREWLAKVRARR